MRPMAKWTSLPIRNEPWLCRRDAVGVSPVRPIPVSLPDERSKRMAMAISDDGWTAAAVGSEVVLLPPDPQAEPRKPVLPDDVTGIGALTFHQNLLFIGGSSSWQDSSRLGWVDVQSPGLGWNALPPPAMVGDTQRPIYGLLHSFDRLIALDGAFTPKLALIYDTTEPRAAKFVDHVSIPSGLDDLPVDAAVGRSYVAILTKSRNEAGRAWKVGIFDFDTMDEIATFYQHASHAEQMEIPVRLAMVEDLLLIAHDMKGIGAVRLDDRRPSRYENVSAITPWAHSYVPLERIDYHSPLGQGHVLDIQPTDDPHAFAVTMRRGSNYWWEEVVIR